MNGDTLLAREDLLRLQILIRQPVRAIRLDENAPALYALTDKGEAHLPLHPTVPTARYLHHVREFLSEHYLQRPGGYPRHLGRWTRTGAGTQRLDRMLLLGEPEAVVSVACAPALPLALAQACWWALPNTEIARRLLAKPTVQTAPLGLELANHLLEFLPFEDDALNAAESVRLCLLPGLIDDTRVAALWQRSGRRNPYCLGFLQAERDDYPPNVTAHPALPILAELLGDRAASGSRHAAMLLYVCDTAGRRWLTLLRQLLQKPTDQDIVVAAFRALDTHIDADLDAHAIRDTDAAWSRARLYDAGVAADRDFDATRQQLDSLAPEIAADFHERLIAIRVLAVLGEHSLDGILAGSRTSGTVLRKRIAPLVACVEATTACLLGD